jgi:hypothetical protein
VGRSAPEGAELPLALRRRLHLERWDTHVSLGLLEEARADQAYWQEHFAGSLDEPESGSSAIKGVEVGGLGHPAQGSAGDRLSEDERVERIRLAQRKLERGVGEPFTDRFTRQWLLRDAELVLDPRLEGNAIRGCTSVRHLASRQIALHNVMSGAPLRQTVDTLSTGAARAQAGRETLQRALYGRSAAWGGPVRDAWPAVTYGHLAAVPVRGGLVCVGLGPERDGGRRLWEYAVAEWTEIPHRFIETAVAGPDGIFLATRDERVLMVGWSDGLPRWQRDVPGMSVARLELAAGRSDDGCFSDALIVVGEDQRVVVVEAATGGRLRRPPTELGTLRASEIIGDVLVVWGDDWLAGVDPQTLDLLWRQPCQEVLGHVGIRERGWIAYRSRGDPDWRLLDARTGRRVLEQSVEVVGDITAIAAEGETLFVAGWVSGDEEAGQRDVVSVAAIDLASGERRWSRSFETTVQVNRTQLAAHPDLIPILLLETAGRPSDVIDLRTLRIQLLDKHSGRPLEPVPIDRHFRTTDAWCNVYMLVTPTRMIVQAAGNVVAFGNSRLGLSP